MAARENFVAFVVRRLRPANMLSGQHFIVASARSKVLMSPPSR